MNRRNEFLILASLFALWLVSLSVWYVATGLGPPDGWSVFALHWGSIIGGSFAALAAAGTILTMRYQTEKNIAAVRQQTKKTVAATKAQSDEIRRQTKELRIIEDRRVAMEYAAHLRNAASKWRLCVISMSNLAISHLSTWKKKEQPLEHEWIKATPDLPEIDFGWLPHEYRLSIAAALRTSFEMRQQVTTPSETRLMLDGDASWIAGYWDLSELCALYCATLLNAIAEEIEKSGIINSDLVIDAEQIKSTIQTVEPNIKVRVFCRLIGLEFEPIKGANEYALFLPEVEEKTLEAFL